MTVRAGRMGAALLLGLLLALAHPVLAGGKVALVIGNSDYAHASRLANPGNDARALADKLGALGFEVQLHQDLGGQGMRVALGEFTEAALGADIALVFYAGHGIEMGGHNYLVPVDAQMRSEATAQFEALSLDQVIASVGQASKLGVVLLDACRDNPFASSMQRNNGTRSMSRGLAPVSIEGQQGLLVSFAAEEGSTADDGDGMHSPYTAALLEVIDDPGLEVGRMFRKVRAHVREATGGRQVPIERMQLPDEAIYFVPEGAAPVETPVAQPPLTQPPATRDPMMVFLDAVQSGEIEPLSDFVSRYPDHPRAADARKLVHAMQDEAFWKRTLTEDTVEGYRRYLLAFADGQYTDEATAKLAALTQPAPAPVTQPPVTQPPVTQPPAARVQPSFDCNRASTSIEFAICGNSDLARQDNALARAYASARSNGWVSSSAQRQWITERRAVCEGMGNGLEACVSAVNSDRINALSSGRLSGNVAPGFNCAKAGTSVERAICNSDVLARQDQRLLRAYKSARSRGQTSANTQRNWIRQREANCAERGAGVAICVAETTAARIRALGG